MKFKIQHKLLLGSMLILLITIILVAVTGRIWFQHEFQQFLAKNQISMESLAPPPRDRPAFGGFEQIFLLFTIFGAVLATIMSFVFARYLVTPLERVIQATQAIAKGNYKSRVTSSSKDEVGELCVAVNEMASELEKMEQIRRDLVSNVAHELATPLTNIGGYLRAINDGTIKYGDEMKETLVLLESETDRLSNLVGDVRALYWVDSPKKDLKLEKLDLNKLIKEVVKNMKPKFETKSLDFEMSLQEDLPTVEVDRDKFIQVMMNLLANAIAYTSDGGHIAVSTGVKNDEVFIAIKDDGIGISKEDIPYIFERFYRVDKSRSRKTGGTGVGLTIVKDLIDAHSGRMEVKSKFGKGSEFFVYLPISHP
ncbi:MAG: histidine kinase,HAMP domain-containing protein,histidine kinase [Candidatus Peregrinibacteria bacterium GW2011_GWF2_39_17]|nr:MAG: histidine kinase,HAMP domain-containing protein,histidine kinase [Candidatus Peregrinibacteria bacterium GW2011_GWF2_39_17]HCW31877.1 hypothetical protein [Candidatus Peregrinibacteria bacterium]